MLICNHNFISRKLIASQIFSVQLYEGMLSISCWTKIKDKILCVAFNHLMYAFVDEMVVSSTYSFYCIQICQEFEACYSTSRSFALNIW